MLKKNGFLKHLLLKIQNSLKLASAMFSIYFLYSLMNLQIKNRRPFGIKHIFYTHPKS